MHRVVMLVATALALGGLALAIRGPVAARTGPSASSSHDFMAAGTLRSDDDDDRDDDDHEDDRDDDDDDRDDDERDDDCDNSGPGNCEDRAAGGVLPAAPGEIAPDGSIVVQIVDESFQPNRIEIQPGQAVTFVNTDNDDHTATGAAFDTGIIPESGGTATVTLTEPGTYDFLCAIHPEMTGAIVVSGGDGTPATEATPETDATPDATPDAAAGEAPVSIVDFAFAEESITVAPGTTVVWTNDGQAPHTVTGNWADSGTLLSGASFSFTFEEPGTYGYVCSFHPEMVGEVVVDPAAVSSGGVIVASSAVSLEKAGLLAGALIAPFLLLMAYRGRSAAFSGRHRATVVDGRRGRATGPDRTHV